MRPDTGLPSIVPNQHNPWREYFCLSRPSPRGGWVVQKIQVESPASPRGLVFWETFVVLPGERHSAYPDTFFYPFGVHQDGFMSVNATATFYEGLSNGFIRTHIFLNMPGKGVEIQQPSQSALSTTNSAIENQLNQFAADQSIRVSNTLGILRSGTAASSLNFWKCGFPLHTPWPHSKSRCKLNRSPTQSDMSFFFRGLAAIH
jgi:hypothetical protein